MIDFFEFVGGAIALLAVMLVFSLVTKGVFSLLASEAKEGRQVTAESLAEKFLFSVSPVTSYLFRRWIGLICAVLIFTLLLIKTSVSFYGALGCSMVAFAIVGVLTPALLKFIRKSSAVSESVKNKF